MVVEYKLRTGALAQDALSAPGLLSRGKLSLAPSRISGIDEVRRIFDACANSAGLRAGEEDAGGDDR